MACAAASIWTGSMAPFCTSWPIQSCAPLIRSGAWPAWEALRNAVRPSATTWTLTVIPLSSPNFFAAAWIAGDSN